MSVTQMLHASPRRTIRVKTRVRYMRARQQWRHATLDASHFFFSSPSSGVSLLFCLPSISSPSASPFLRLFVPANVRIAREIILLFLLFAHVLKMQVFFLAFHPPPRFTNAIDTCVSGPRTVQYIHRSEGRFRGEKWHEWYTGGFSPLGNETDRTRSYTYSSLSL